MELVSHFVEVAACTHFELYRGSAEHIGLQYGLSAFGQF
jgi:hypothetical protein